MDSLIHYSDHTSFRRRPGGVLRGPAGESRRKKARSLGILVLCVGMVACSDEQVPEGTAASDPLARAAAAGVQVDTVGVRDIASGDTLNTMAGLTIIDREVTFPPTAKDGEVFAWDYYAESLNPVKLIIMRANGKQLELVGESPMSIPRQLGLNRLELPEPIPIRWRDMMGLYQPEAGPVSFRKIRNYKTLISSQPYQRPFTSRDRFAMYGWRYSFACSGTSAVSSNSEADYGAGVLITCRNERPYPTLENRSIAAAA